MTAAHEIDHPILIGVADFKNAKRQQRQDGADEPLALILEAIRLAIEDCGLTDQAKRAQLQADIDSISVVRPWSWPYPDLASTLAQRLGVESKQNLYRFNSPHGGNQPAKLLDEACQRIAHGRTKVALLTGGEALDSLAGYLKAGQLPPPGWTSVDFDSFAADALRPPSGDSLEGIHGLGAPIQVYALYENAFRAHLHQSFAQNHDASAQMYAQFSSISASHPFSWHVGKSDSSGTIGTATATNRMICTPYTKLMCAFNQVNIASACLVTSTTYAQQMGIPQDRWIYIKGGAGTAESEEFYLRPQYYSSEAIDQSIEAALKVAGVKKEQIDLYDFYSCFPIVPKLAAHHLNLPTADPARPLTILGGLTSFGGAGNNYSMHAITEMVRQLRQGPRQRPVHGLILANGGVLSYQHVVVLSNQARQAQYPEQHALPEHCQQLDAQHFDAVAAPGSATIEAYTVEYSRKGVPKRGHVIGRLQSNGHRFMANHADEHTLLQLANVQGEEVVGRVGRVFQNEAEDERQNLFTLVSEQKL